MKQISCVGLILGSLAVLCAAHAAVPGDPVQSPLDGGALARELLRTFMTDAQFEAEAAKVHARFKDWEKETQCNLDQYLNDRLVGIALSAAGGEVERIQKGFVWLAYYKHFNQQMHPVVEKFLIEHRNSMSRLLTDFTWEKASAYVMSKNWRQDLAERKASKDEPLKAAEAPQPNTLALTNDLASAASAPETVPTAKPIDAQIALPQE